jgi:hypothetical protein
VILSLAEVENVWDYLSSSEALSNAQIF